MEKCWLEGSFQHGLDCFVVNNCYVGIFYLEGKLKLSHVILKFSWAKLEARFEFSLIMEKLWDTQINTRIYWNRSFAVSDLFICLQSIKFYTFHCHILKNIDVWKGDSSMRQKINCCSFQWVLPIWVGFCLNSGKLFFLQVSF